MLDAAGFAHRVAGNLDVMARAMAVLLTNVDRAGSRLPVGALLLGLVVGGLVLLWRSHEERGPRRQVVGYAAALLGLCLIWPFNQQERFYVPLLPVLLLAAGECGAGAWRLLRRASGTAPGRACLAVGGGALLFLLAAQRSDHPVLLGRWSWSYAALLATLGAAWIGALLWLRGGRALPAPPRQLLVLLPALAAVPFAHHAFVEWPAQKRAFDERRASEPQPEPLARIDVDPRLEQVAVFLRDRTPPDTVLMTDVPSMLQAMSGRRCIPFVYTLDPARVLTDGADLVFYTREIPEAAAVMDAVAPELQPVLQLPPVEESGRIVIPAVFRTR
ncbi:MAG TPA: hypothetical protein VK824_02510 [Planctomycetota bacterium]|nr:hypothetical protein [Planctomycetota bacterium]